MGIRTASWDFSPNTLMIIHEMGLLYDSSLMADDDPYELVADGEPTGIVELPPEWIRDDAVYFNMLRFSGLRPYTPPSAVEEIFKAEFDGAWDEGGLFLLTMHPHVIGHRSRIGRAGTAGPLHKDARPRAGSRPTSRSRAGARRAHRRAHSAVYSAAALSAPARRGSPANVAATSDGAHPSVASPTTISPIVVPG